MFRTSMTSKAAVHATIWTVIGITGGWVAIAAFRWGGGRILTAAATAASK